jgi:uncharacterized protein YecT (DUF1311 family)
MKKALLIAVGCAFAVPAFAQYSGPAVETCRAFAKREIARDGTQAKDVVLEKETLSMERYTRKMGNQFVSSILTGSGALVLEGAPSAELSFICLLADEKRAVFFEWLPRPNASALAQCTRDEGLRAKPRPCLETLLQVAENDLTHAYASRFQDARERDHGTGKEEAVDVFRRANEEWRQYRDAECSRRRGTAPQGVAADDHQIACMVELTRRRALDMR